MLADTSFDLHLMHSSMEVLMPHQLHMTWPTVACSHMPTRSHLDQAPLLLCSLHAVITAILLYSASLSWHQVCPVFPSAAECVVPARGVKSNIQVLTLRILAAA